MPKEPTIKDLSRVAAVDHKNRRVLLWRDRWYDLDKIEDKDFVESVLKLPSLRTQN